MSFRGGGARRGHLSHKVPNVKLRPVPATAPSLTKGGEDGSGSDGPSASKRSRRNNKPEERELSAMDKETMKRLDAEDGVVDESFDDPELSHALHSKPFFQINLSFTSLSGSEKEDLSHMAQAMGVSRIDPALMIDTRALVAREVGSPKYDSAILNRIPVFQPEWISACYERWLAGEGLEKVLEMKEFRLKPFKGLKIALTGVEPISRRHEFRDYIERNGGIYSGGLDRSCTHLIVSSNTRLPSPYDSSKLSAKIAFAFKTNAESMSRKKVLEELSAQLEEFSAPGVEKAMNELSKLPYISVVWEGWIKDCVELGSRFNTDKWDLQMTDRHPKESDTEVFKEAEAARRREELVASRELLDMVMANESSTAQQPAADAAEGPWDATSNAATAEQLEQAKMRKRPAPSSGRLTRNPSGLATMDQMLQDMVQGITSTTSENLTQPVPESNAMLVTGPLPAATGDTESQRRRRSRLAPVQPSSEDLKNAGLAPRPASIVHQARAGAFDAVGKGNGLRTSPFHFGQHLNGAAASSSTSSATQYDPTLFEGLSFTIHVPGCDTKKLVEAIKLNGATLVSDAERTAGHHVDIVIVKLGSSDVPDQLAEHTKLATECWVERCIQSKSLQRLDSHVAFQPLGSPMPIPGADKLNIHLSGLPLDQQHFSKKLIKAIGATYKKDMTRKTTTHLISAHEGGYKLEKAHEWKIPVVSVDWLLAMAKSGSIQPTHRFSRSWRRTDVDTVPPVISTGSNLSVIGDAGSLFELKAISPSKSQANRSADAEVAQLAEESSGLKRKLGLIPTDVDVPDQKLSCAHPSVIHNNMDTDQEMAIEPLSAALTASGLIESRRQSEIDISHADQQVLNRSKSAPEAGVKSFQHLAMETKKPISKPTSNLVPVASSAPVNISNILHELATADGEAAPTIEATPSVRAKRARPAARQRVAIASSARSTGTPGYLFSPEAISPEVVNRESASPAAKSSRACEDLRPNVNQNVQGTAECDESIRVTYQDPTAERERKRLLDQFNETQQSRSKRQK